MEETKKELIEQNRAGATINGNKYEIIQYTSKTIRVLLNGKYVGDNNNLKHLRDIAEFKSVNIYNGNGNLKNTRKLGIDIIKRLK